MRPDPLLDAMFQPGEESLLPALASARRRRIRRVLVPAIASAACLAATVHLIPSLQHPPLAISPSPVVQTISSRPLLPREVARTTQASVEVISTPAASAAPVAIADSELLASYQPGRVALVGAGEDLRVIEF